MELDYSNFKKKKYVRIEKNLKEVSLEDAQRAERRRKRREQLGLSSDSSDVCMIVYTKIHFIDFNLMIEEEEKGFRAIVTYKETHTIQEIRNQIILCLMSSSPRIKNYGVMAWLIDNCGFSYNSKSIDHRHVLNLMNIKKDGLVFDDNEHIITFHSSNHGLPMVSTIHFELYGNLGLKVYDTLKLLQSNYEADNFFSEPTSIPDLDKHVFSTAFRKERAVEILTFLLHRDPSVFASREEMLDFFFSCIDVLFQYATSYTARLDVDWDTLKRTVRQRADRSLEVKKSYVSYLYHKKQYLKAKKKEKLDLRLKGQTGKDPRDLFNQSSLFLHESHDLASLKRMYKIAKKCYLSEKMDQDTFASTCLSELIRVPMVSQLIQWIQSRVIREWFRENQWDVDYVFVGL